MIIYEIRNKIVEKPYIGYSTKFNSDEELQKSRYWGSGTYIKNSIEKYGKENFERKVLLKNIFNFGELKRYECLWIKKKNSHISLNGYNLTWGGDGNITPTEEQKKEHSNRMLKYFKISINKEMHSKRQKKRFENLEERKKDSMAQIRYQKSHPNAKQKMSEIKKKYYIDNPQSKIEASKRTKKYFIDHPEKRIEFGKFMKGKYSGGKHPCAKAVVLISPNGEEYELLSYKLFCEQHQLNSKNICSVLRGRRKHHKGWTGKYLEEIK